MADSSRIGIKCFDCGYWQSGETTSYLFRDRCPKCKSSHVQQFNWDANAATERERSVILASNIAHNPATLSEGEVVALVNSWLIQNHPKKSESSLTQKTFEEKCGWERINSATWNGEYWAFPDGKFYETTRSVDRGWPQECFEGASPVRRPNPRGIGVKLLSALLYAFIYSLIAPLVIFIVLVVKGGGTISVDWSPLLLIFILFGGYKGFTKVPRK